MIGSAHTCATPEADIINYHPPSLEITDIPPRSDRGLILSAHYLSLTHEKKEIRGMGYSADVVPAAAEHRQLQLV